MSYHTQVQLSFDGADFFAAMPDEKVQPALAAAAAAFDLYPPRGVNPFHVEIQAWAKRAKQSRKP